MRDTAAASASTGRATGAAKACGRRSAGEAKAVEAEAYEPKMNVTPNAVASKD